MTEVKKETAGAVSMETNKSLATIAKKFKYGQAELDLVRNTIAVGANETELALFLTICRNKNLDPFSNQIYFIKRKTWNKIKQQYDEKVTIQTGIDGYRSIAERTGAYAGSDDPIFAVDDMTKKPEIAKVTIWKMVQGQKVAFTASARWSEYAPKDEKQAFMWNKMPFLMLGKVAEALALRKAFPNDLSGIYTKEEMDQAPGEVVKSVVPVKEDVPFGPPSDQAPIGQEEPDINHIVPGNPPVSKYPVETGKPVYEQLKLYLDKAETLEQITEIENTAKVFKKVMELSKVAQFRSDLAGARERVVKARMEITQ